MGKRSEQFPPLVIDENSAFEATAANVRLTSRERSDLLSRFGEEAINAKIEQLSRYLRSHRTRYKSHYWVLREWLRREKTIELAVPKAAPLIEEAEIQARAEILQRIRVREGFPETTVEQCKDAIRKLDREKGGL